MASRTSACPSFLLAFVLAAAAAAEKAERRTDTLRTSPGLALQAALDRAGFSPGEIDGRPGKVTKRALVAFQQANDLTPSGEIDDDTWDALGVEPGESSETLARYSITREDATGPFTPEIPDDMEAKAELSALGYRDVVEALAERFHSSPGLLRALNPGASFAADEVIEVPQVSSSSRSGDATDVTVFVSKTSQTLTVRNDDDEILLFAPVTVGSEHDPLPIGRWKVKGVKRDPDFYYNPDLFWDADASDDKAKIPAGPNNPVGAVWIDLDKPHYGIHGTPEPGKIGYRESHGCVRLTNWDALELADLVKPGTAVIFER